MSAAAGRLMCGHLRMVWFDYVYAMGHYSDVAGRASRREFWGFTLIYLVMVIGLSLLGRSLGLSVEVPLNGLAPSPFEVQLGLLGPIVMLAHVVPNWSISCRRLHDLGCSAWWLTLGMVPLIGPLILLGFFVRSGDDADNIYGPIAR